MTHNPINKCIYCDATYELTDEHIVAYGLGGEDVLPKASCKACAKITGAFEEEVLRGLWKFVRAVLGFPTRNPKEMPRSYTFQVETKDGENKIILDESEKLAIAGFPEYATPAFLAPREFTPGILMTGYRMVGFGSSIDELLKKYNLRSIGGSMTYKGTSFPRMLAKIALGFAVARFSLDKFEEIYVRNCILNKKDDVGIWVGSDFWEVSQAQLEAEERSRNSSSIGVDAKGNVLVRIRLFSFSPHSPAYIVVVGRLFPDTSMEKEGAVAKAFSKVFPLLGTH